MLLFSLGETKALASVSGPIEVRLAAENPSRATFEVSVRPLSNVPGTDAKSLSYTMRSLLSPSIILTQNPRTLLQLVVQSLTPSLTTMFQPSLVAAMINASSLALLNAGSIQMRGVVCAVSVGRVLSSSKLSSRLILDPNEKESASLDTGGCFAFMFSSPGVQVVWNNWHSSSSSFSEDDLQSAINLALRGAKSVWAAMKASVGTMGARKVILITGSIVDSDEGDNSDDEESKDIGGEIDDDKMEI